MNIAIHKVSLNHEIEICLNIRAKVFIEGQNIPVEEEIDDLDGISDHYILKLDGAPVGTARVRYIDNKAKIERVAILSKYRGLGLGKELMEYVVKDIKASKLVNMAVLGAQMYAIPFYEKLGFSVCSDEYEDAGITHKEMQIVFS